MAYGVTSTTLLLAVGISPALASASVHIAEVGTTLASGVSHWRFGNVDWKKVIWLAVPGGVGAFFGAVVLVSVITAEAAEPIVAIFLFSLGVYVVALAASIGFLLTLSFAEVPWSVVGALLVGGVVAAPVAAWVVRILPMRVLGTAVGGVILITNMKTFLGAVGVSGGVVFVVYALIVVVWVAALVHSVTVNRQESKTVAEGQPA